MPIVFPFQPLFRGEGKFGAINQNLTCFDSDDNPFVTNLPLKTLQPIGFDNAIVRCVFQGM